MVTSREQIGDLVEGFVRREFRVGPGDLLFARNVHLYEAGFVDSTGVVELIAFVEATFAVSLGDDQIFSDDFTTIDGISRVVHTCLLQKLVERDASMAG